MTTFFFFAFLLVAVVVRFWAGWHYTKHLDSLPPAEREAWLRVMRERGI